MALSESPRQQALREFADSICTVCRSPKKPKQSFCLKCYYALPEEMRKALYRRFGSGYEEAYDDAKDWLKQERRAGTTVCSHLNEWLSCPQCKNS